MHLKYRPKTFDEVVGNAEVVASLKELLSRPFEQRVPTYFLTGVPGCGKTTIMYILAHELGAKYPGVDLIEINSSSDNGIETARQISAQAASPSLFGGVKVFCLDECNRLTSDAAKALLTITERPPLGIYFIIVTMHPEKLPAALKARGPNYYLAPLTRKDLVVLLKRVVKNESIRITQQMAELLIAYSEGVPRKLLMGLNIIKGCEDVAAARKLLTQHESEKDPEVIDIARAITQGMNTAIFQGLLRDRLGDMKADPERYRIIIGSYLTKVALSPSNVSSMERLGSLLKAFSEPLPSGSGHIKLVSNLIDAHACMKSILGV